MTEEIGTEKPAPKVNYSGTNEPKVVTPPTDRKPVRVIVDADLVQNKKPLGRKIAETFGGESLRTVRDSIVTEVILPQFKEMLFDSLITGARRSIFGSDRNGAANDRARGTKYGTQQYNQMYVSPNKGYGGSAPSQQRAAEADTRGPNEFRDFLFQSRGQAEEIIDNLIAVLDQYGTVSVHELKAMIGKTGEFTDQKWGWKNLNQAGVIRDGHGYRLDLPKLVSLD
ncbi:hypothetical protein PBI_SPORTO_50 [Arthrobacter phage Sporto]|nr:hypothetical protein PBI_SPORTO_50 [Arthrobacter phage Sporto]